MLRRASGACTPVLHPASCIHTSLSSSSLNQLCVCSQNWMAQSLSWEDIQTKNAIYWSATAKVTVLTGRWEQTYVLPPIGLKFNSLWAVSPHKKSFLWSCASDHQIIITYCQIQSIHKNKVTSEIKSLIVCLPGLRKIMHTPHFKILHVPTCMYTKIHTHLLMVLTAFYFIGQAGLELVIILH